MPAVKSRYIPALDGVRALAVLAVIAYHMGFGWAQGGLLGVTVFFVLSGYLITSLLLIEWDNTRTINLPKFWMRRVRRLLPAILLVIAVIAALCVLLDHAMLTKLRDDLWAALLFVTNWWYIFHDVSYFEALGAPSPLVHFWSLAIEEQFYLVWPVALFAAHKAGAKRTTMRNATLVLALLSALEMALLFHPGDDPSRVYYGTDTRAFSLLIGAWLAFVWPSHLLGAKKSVHLDKNKRHMLDGVGALALVGLVAMMVLADGFSPFMYWGGIFLASVLTAVLIAVMVHPSSVLGQVFAARPMVWIGVRSYGIYLWHFPLLLLMNPRNFTGETPWWLYLIQLAVIFAAAALSYRFVEDPIRKGALGRMVKEARAGTFKVQTWLRRKAPLVACVALTSVVAVGGLLLVPATAGIGDVELLQQQAEQAQQEAHAALENSSASEDQAAEDGVAPVPSDAFDILLIGDSVSVRAVPNFNERFPHGLIDSALNRQFSTGQEVLELYQAQHKVGNVVVFALGTNGPVTDAEIDAMMAVLQDTAHVFFINTRSPQPWVAETNAALAAAAQRYDKVQLIDWFEHSASHDEYFDGDGTHLNDEGAQVYVDMIYQAVVQFLPEYSEDVPVE